MIENMVKKVSSVTGVEEFNEYDYLAIDWSDFPFDETEKTYELNDLEKVKPYLVVAKFYGDSYINLQEILFLINNIGDLSNLTGEVIIRVPRILKLLNYVQGKKNA